MTRSSKKGPYVDQRLLKKIERLQPGERTPIKTWSRASSIAPEMVGFVFAVHTGRDFLPVTISEEMVGHKLGEFAPTKKFVRHGGRLQREVEAKAGAGATPAMKTEETQPEPTKG